MRRERALKVVLVVGSVRRCPPRIWETGTRDVFFALRITLRFYSGYREFPTT